MSPTYALACAYAAFDAGLIDEAVTYLWDYNHWTGRGWPTNRDNESLAKNLTARISHLPCLPLAAV